MPGDVNWATTERDKAIAAKSNILRPCLVGEDNPYGQDPRYALWPYPAQASGDRLRNILGLPLDEYLEKFDRVNLCPQKWSLRVARETAKGLTLAYVGGTLVLLGRKVCSAFHVEYEPLTRHRYWVGNGGAEHLDVVILPHPSGLCRAWNDPGAKLRARAVTFGE